MHFFYNQGWQELESRVSGSENTGPESLQPMYQYVWSRRYIDAPILRDKNTDADGLCDDERLYYLGDANFNVTTLVNTGGDAVERYVYSPYGVLTIYDATWSNTRSASSYANVYTYTGRQLDTETGLYYYRARFYSAQLGRFLSRDILTYEGSTWNLYEYTSGEPTWATDPSGMQADEPPAEKCENGCGCCCRHVSIVKDGKGFGDSIDLGYYAKKNRWGNFKVHFKWKVTFTIKGDITLCKFEHREKGRFNDDQEHSQTVVKELRYAKTSPHDHAATSCTFSWTDPPGQANILPSMYPWSFVGSFEPTCIGSDGTELSATLDLTMKLDSAPPADYGPSKDPPTFGTFKDNLPIERDGKCPRQKEDKKDKKG